MKRKMHLRAVTLYSNAGISFPLCYANQELLDMEKVHLWTTPRMEDVTCKRCWKLHKARYA